MKLRGARREDEAAIRALHIAAFATSQEAELVDALRNAAAATVSEVAIDGVSALGLGPLAVLPQRQRRGIGAALLRRALERAREAGVGAVVLVGEPHYYRRFGFVPARQFGLHCKWAGTEEAFMALELYPGALQGARGLVSYHAAFDA